MRLVDLSVNEFISELASKSPAPGGGSVAALSGGLSAALCAMVARLTLDKEKYRDAWGRMEELIRDADTLADRFIELIDEDTLAYNEVLSAMRLPKENEEQNRARKEAIQEATRKAAQIPLDTLRAVLRLTDLAPVAIEMGNPNCITDAGTAVQLIRTAANAAAYNVRINLPGIRDQEFVTECDREVERILDIINSVVVSLEKMVETAMA